MNRQLVLALAMAGLLASTPAAVPQAPPVAIKPAAPPPTSPALTPSTLPSLEPKTPTIVPVLPRDTAEPRSPIVSESARAERSSEPKYASPPPGAESADIPESGAGYDPCLHPTSPPSYCKDLK